MRDEQEAHHEADVSGVFEVVRGHCPEVAVGVATAQQQELTPQLSRPVHRVPDQVDAL